MTSELPSSTGLQIEMGPPEWVDPDLEFIETLRRQAGESFVKCFQCGTCTGTCDLAPDAEPFPRKEMIWAAWGLKDRLVRDPDIWLCHHCQDCSANCPRGARPGDVLAAVRQACVQRFAFPGFVARWCNEPSALLLLLGIPMALLTLALYFRDEIGTFFGFTVGFDDRISFAYSNAFLPHWLINLFFFTLSGVVLLVLVVGALRYWRAARYPQALERPPGERTGVLTCAWRVLKDTLLHGRFTKCTKAKGRSWSHFMVMFGFAGLSIVTLWVITSRINPLLGEGFIYPFNFWSPWKMLANLAGAAVAAGCLWMTWDRLRDDDSPAGGSWFDWSFLGLVLLVVGTGFFTEILHYVRLEPHRHIVYFAHLVFVGALILYLPYSKFAHAIYRFVAMVYAEHVGREVTTPASVSTTPAKQSEEVIAS